MTDESSAGGPVNRREVVGASSLNKATIRGRSMRYSRSTTHAGA